MQNWTRPPRESFTTPSWCLCTPGCQIWSQIVVRFLDISGQHGGQAFGGFSGFRISQVWGYISPSRPRQSSGSYSLRHFFAFLVRMVAGFGHIESQPYLQPSRGNHGWRFTARIQVLNEISDFAPVNRISSFPAETMVDGLPRAFSLWHSGPSLTITLDLTT